MAFLRIGWETQAVRELGGKSRLNVATALLAAGHEDHVLTFGLRLGVKASHGAKDRFIDGFAPELDDLPFDTG